MSDLDEHEQRVDALMRASVPNLRTATMRSPIPNLRKRHGSARNNWMVAPSTTVVLIVGLVAIGTDRTDQSPGNDSSRLHWQVIVLPDGLNPTFIAEPGSQAGPPGTTTMVNVYATAAAPAGPVVAVSASMGRPGLDIIPAAAGSNFEETTINGRRAAFADATFGQRLLLIEVDGHWVELRSRNIDDSTLQELAKGIERNPDSTEPSLPPILSTVSLWYHLQTR